MRSSSVPSWPGSLFLPIPVLSFLHSFLCPSSLFKCSPILLILVPVGHSLLSSHTSFLPCIIIPSFPFYPSLMYSTTLSFLAAVGHSPSLPFSIIFSFFSSTFHSCLFLSFLHSLPSLSQVFYLSVISCCCGSFSVPSTLNYLLIFLPHISFL